MVDVDCGRQGFDVVLLGTIEVTHLNLELQAGQVVEVLLQVVSLEQLEAKSLLFFDSWLPLEVLYRLVAVDWLGAKGLDEGVKLLRNSQKLSAVTRRLNVIDASFEVKQLHFFNLFAPWLVVGAQTLLRRSRHLFSLSVEIPDVVLCVTNNNIYLHCHQLLHENEI